MNNACPECGAIYAVAEKDVGRRIACKKCNASLIVTEQGLEHDGPEAASSKKQETLERDRDRSRDDSGRRRRNRDDDADDRPRKPKGPGFGGVMKKIKSVADIPTWLYGIGLLVTIYSFHTPLLDSATVYSRVGEAQSAEIDNVADAREVNQRNDGKPSEDDRKSLEKRQKEYTKETPRLNEKINSAQAAANKAKWWNVMYRIIGLIVLAFGAIGYLVGEQPQTKRILGAVTIAIILIHVVAPGLQFHFQAGDLEKPVPSMPSSVSNPMAPKMPQ